MTHRGSGLTDEDFRLTESEYVDEDQGRRSIYDAQKDLEDEKYELPNAKTNKHAKHWSEEMLASWIGPMPAHYVRCAMLALLILPMAVVFLFIQLKTFIVVAIFNYSGYNIRPYLFYDIYTERETELIQEKYNRGPISWGKIKYIAQRYMTYWIVIILLITATKFINEVDIFTLLEKFNVYKKNEVIAHILSIGLSVFLGFANLIPTRAVRPDISSFMSSFSEMDLVIRDSAHTRLKDLTEILEDIKTHHFALFRTDHGCPIIVSTKVPEELNDLPGFPSLLNTDAFDNNQVLRFIQIEEDVDSFFVLRNDVGMCHRVDFNPFQWKDVHADLHKFRLRIQISDLELNLYGGASLVLLVILFSATRDLPTTSILTFWVAWPVLFALIYRRKQSKLASINFFTLNGKERMYQPFNNIQISSDQKIQKRIADFKFVDALYKISPQGRFLLHILLKCAENLKYEWLIHGLRVRDFRRLASMAAALHNTDIAVVTPRGKAYFPAPKHRRVKEDACVVFSITAPEQKGKVAVVRSTNMTKKTFESAFAGLEYRLEPPEFESLYLN